MTAMASTGPARVFNLLASIVRVAASVIAASRIGLYSMTRLPSMPQEAETITAGSASSMRTASSWAANPPKTTECTAPSRAQASIAMTASGIIGR